VDGGSFERVEIVNISGVKWPYWDDRKSEEGRIERNESLRKKFRKAENGTKLEEIMDLRKVWMF
jgi:hypothetical protein